MFILFNRYNSLRDDMLGPLVNLTLLLSNVGAEWGVDRDYVNSDPRDLGYGPIEILFKISDEVVPGRTFSSAEPYFPLRVMVCLKTFKFSMIRSFVK